MEGQGSASTTRQAGGKKRTRPEHPGLMKGEKKRLCGLMDCKKLSPDASMHAVQNERLPLRVVVQVLSFELVRAAAAAAASTIDTAGGEVVPARSLLPKEDGNSYGSSRSAVTTVTEDDQWLRLAIVRLGSIGSI
ncbi:hypothetical protein ABZP36_008535 [Zizania latifolia]